MIKHSSLKLAKDFQPKRSFIDDFRNKMDETSAQPVTIVQFLAMAAFFLFATLAVIAG